jgi:hypothetical protein
VSEAIFHLMALSSSPSPDVFALTMLLGPSRFERGRLTCWIPFVGKST